MPLYEVECRCGNREVYSSARRGWGDALICDECGSEVRVLMAPANFGGDLADRPIPVNQVGRTFRNARDLDAWCDRNNCEVVSKTDSTWREIRDQARQDHVDMVREEGYRDIEDKRQRLKRGRVDRVRAAQEKQMSEYHQQYGSSGSQTVEAAFGPVQES